MSKPKVIESLSEETLKKAPEYATRYTKLGLSTEEINVPKIKELIVELYKECKVGSAPAFFGPFGDPIEALRAIAFVKEAEGTPSNEEVVKFAASKKKIKFESHDFFFGNHEVAWIAFYEFFQKECGIVYDQAKWFELIKELVSVSGWIAMFEHACFIVHRPTIVSMDNEPSARRHSLTGPAIAFGRGNHSEPIYAIHGVNVDKNIVEGNFDWRDIEKQSNAEVRRVMVDIYGKSRYIAESGLKPVHEDDFGTLYIKEFAGDEPMAIVKVVNSTAEQDGTYKDYFIRVDPKAYGGIKTARAAVVSTFRKKNNPKELFFKNPEDYAPEIET